MAACLTGCTTARQHLTDCDDPDTCRGCLPREADTARTVCVRCSGRLHDALTRLPDLVAHIRAHVPLGSGGGAGDVKVRGTRTPPAPLSLTAVDDADALHAALADWCSVVMDGRDVTGPSWAGTMILPASKRARAPGRHGPACPDRVQPGRRPCPGCGPAYDPPRAYGLGAAASLADLASPPAALAAWLRPHLDWALAQPFAGDLVTDLTAAVGKMGARWPVDEHPTRCAAPCPACDRLSLVRYAPTFYRGPVSIACTAGDCGEPLDERYYEHYVRVLTDTPRAHA